MSNDLYAVGTTAASDCSGEGQEVGCTGQDEDDGASVTSNLDPKKCVEWYVTASKGDFQELLKLAKDEPRLVNKKDPFTAYTVLHWGAKHGNAEIIKVFAGTYKVDVNAKTNGGYTPLHIAAQFGHKDIFKLLIEVYKANSNARDFSGRTPEYYLLTKEQTGPKSNVRSEYKGDPMHVVNRPVTRKATLLRGLHNSRGNTLPSMEVSHKVTTGYYRIQK